MKLKPLCVCVSRFARRERAPQRCSTAVGAESPVCPEFEEFVCLEEMCLQNAGETQCLRLSRLSACVGEEFGIAIPLG